MRNASRMTALKILDTFALIAFFEDEQGADLVRGLLLEAESGRINLAMSVVNLGEVWYTVARIVSPQQADAIIQEIRAMSIEIVDADWELTYQAATYKSKGGLSYADCFAAALGKLNAAEVITGAPEFQKLKGEIATLWTAKYYYVGKQIVMIVPTPDWLSTPRVP
jgi:PIN domain nuclease of toxin-antitoxin system